MGCEMVFSRHEHHQPLQDFVLTNGVTTGRLAHAVTEDFVAEALGFGEAVHEVGVCKVALEWSTRSIDRLVVTGVPSLQTTRPQQDKPAGQRRRRPAATPSDDGDDEVNWVVALAPQKKRRQAARPKEVNITRGPRKAPR